MKNRAFTAIELIVSIAIIGILAVIALSRIPNLQPLRIDMARKKMQSDIRYMQSLAMSLKQRTRFSASVASDNYSLYIENPPGTWNLATEPATGKPFTVQLDSGVFSGIDILLVYFNGANRDLVFDQWGNPYSYNSGSGVTTALNNPAGVRLTNTQDVRVERGTGRAYLQP